MNVNIRNIGNSKGVIIPAALLKQVGINDSVDMIVDGDSIIMKAKAHPRDGWEEEFLNDPPSKEEGVFMGDIFEEHLIKDWNW
jgi:antitoxin MazE